MLAYQKIDLATAEHIGAPGELPAALQGLADDDLADLGWTDETLGFRGFGFVVVEVAPAPARRLAKIDFWRLFTADEETLFNRTRRRVAGLVDDDYEDPDKAGLVAMERFLNRFDAAPLVELDHAETIAGVGLLVALDIITADRAAQVLDGEAPE